MGRCVIHLTSPIALTALCLFFSSCLLSGLGKGRKSKKRDKVNKIQLVKSHRPSCTYYRSLEEGDPVLSLSPPGYLRDTTARTLKSQCDDPSRDIPVRETPEVPPLISQWYRDAGGRFQLWPPDSQISQYKVVEVGWDSCFTGNDTITVMTRENVAAYLAARPPSIAGKPVIRDIFRTTYSCSHKENPEDISTSVLVYIRGTPCLYVKLQDNPGFIGFSHEKSLSITMKCDPEGNPGDSYKWKIHLLDENNHLLDSTIIETQVKKEK